MYSAVGHLDGRAGSVNGRPSARACKIMRRAHTAASTELLPDGRNDLVRMVVETLKAFPPTCSDVRCPSLVKVDHQHMQTRPERS